MKEGLGIATFCLAWWERRSLCVILVSLPYLCISTGLPSGKWKEEYCHYSCSQTGKKKEKEDISIHCPLGKVTGSLLLWILYEFCIGVGTWNGLYLGDYSIHGDFLVKSYRQFPVQAWEFPLEKVQIILKTSMMYLFSLKNCVRRRGTCLSALDFSLRKAKESLFPKAHGCQCGSYFRFLSGFVYFKDQGF